MFCGYYFACQSDSERLPLCGIFDIPALMGLLAVLIPQSFRTGISAYGWTSQTLPQINRFRHRAVLTAGVLKEGYGFSSHTGCSHLVSVRVTPLHWYDGHIVEIHTA